jgi:sugar (pentulose or hexulose) kinase
MKFQVFDIGGSYLKIYKSVSKSVIKIPMFEQQTIELKKLKQLIIDNIDENVDCIGISSQMHGFVLFDQDGQNISDFITWKNSAEKNILHSEIFYDFYKTGLKKRNDLPINNLNSYIEKNKLCNHKVRFKNITEAILDTSLNKTHITMACGSGFLNILNKQYIIEYSDYFKKKYNIDLIFDDIVTEKIIVGYINKFNKFIPVYCGLGDFQASIYSSPEINNCLFINMATGSQIAILNKTLNISEIIECSAFSYRPYFNDEYIKCITHIPSGRYLNIFHKFFKEADFDIWDKFNDLVLEDLQSSSIKINTDIFSDEGITISNIKEGGLTIKNLTIAIMFNYLMQYINIIRDNKLTFKKIIISGGIAKKIKVIKYFFENELKKPVIINENDDDSIHGVIKFLTI